PQPEPGGLVDLPNASAPSEPAAPKAEDLNLTPTPSPVEIPPSSGAEVTRASTTTAAAMGLIALPNLGRGKFPDDDQVVSDSSASDITDMPSPGQKVSEPQVESEPHVVVSGENFWTISKDYYGSGRYYKALWKANNQLVSAPEKLAVGMTVRIPPPESLDRGLIEPARSPRATASTSVHRTARPVSKNGRTQASVRNVELTLPIADTADEGSSGNSLRNGDPSDDSADRSPRKVYKVRPNETARSIARDVLGSPSRYKEILELNSSVLDEHDVIAAGQILELPEDAKVAQRRR
ncbi:LysM peptidoglycan-binding domain-containing protein, partial [Singulisphaera rosea]